MKTSFWRELVRPDSLGRKGSRKGRSHRFAAGRIRPVCGPVVGQIGSAHSPLPGRPGFTKSARTGVTRPTTQTAYRAGGYSNQSWFCAKRSLQKRGDEPNLRWQRSRESCFFDRQQPPDRAAHGAVAA